MTTSRIAVVVLAAGLGTRMKSDRPKVMHALAGRPMIGHVAAAAAALKPEKVVLVVGPGMEEVAKAAADAAPGVPIATAVQKERKGTGHAVMQARASLGEFPGDVVVMFGDTPFVGGATLRRLIEARRKGDHAVAACGFRPADPLLFGRMVLDRKGRLQRIVEARDATAKELKIGLCNGGIVAICGKRLGRLLDALDDKNAKKEFYLTDIVRHAQARKWTCIAIEAPAEEVLGIDSRALLAQAEAIAQARLRTCAMEGGATLVDPGSTWFSWDTKLGRDVTIDPQVRFGPGVEIGDGVAIRAFCHLEGARVDSGATVGPFARLRPGARIGAGAHIGNFVEIKNATVEAGAKINHLSYVGDARVGAKANVGAGTITCNYDGYVKSFTDIGEGAFIGSNTSLVAPVKIGDGAIVGAGSVVIRDVAPDALVVARGRQEDKPEWARAFRARRAAEKLERQAAAMRARGRNRKE